jgi:hypothetical protein
MFLGHPRVLGKNGSVDAHPFGGWSPYSRFFHLRFVLID